MENLGGAVCSCRIISGQSFVSDSNISCSISNVSNASHGVAAECIENSPLGCDPPKNGINVEDTLDFGSLLICNKNQENNKLIFYLKINEFDRKRAIRTLQKYLK